MNDTRAGSPETETVLRTWSDKDGKGEEDGAAGHTFAVAVAKKSYTSLLISLARCKSLTPPICASIKWSQWTVVGTAAVAIPADMNWRRAIWSSDVRDAVRVQSAYDNAPEQSHPGKLLAGGFASVRKLYSTQGARTYVWAELEVADTASDVLVMRVVKMAVEDLLGEGQGALQPWGGERGNDVGTRERNTSGGRWQGCPRCAGS